MKRKVVLTPAARDDAHRIDNWWRENRPAAAGLFGEELAASLALLEVAPEMSRPYRHPGIPRLRRVLLRSTRYHVYYVIGDETVRILRLQCFPRTAASPGASSLITPPERQSSLQAVALYGEGDRDRASAT